MSNKIKEIILIFWGSLAICLYIADSFGWIDLHQWLQLICHYEYSYAETARLLLPVLFITMALIEIFKIVSVSFQMGRTPVAPLLGTSHEVRLLPSRLQDDAVSVSSFASRGDDMVVLESVDTSEDKLQTIRDRHRHEQEIHHEKVMAAIRDYLYEILAPYMKNDDIDALYKNVERWQYSNEPELSPTITDGRLSTLDLRHLAWNIGERLKWPGERRATFIKLSFPHELRDSDVSSIRRNLRQQGDSIIPIDIPDKRDFAFHKPVSGE